MKRSGASYVSCLTRLPTGFDSFLSEVAESMMRNAAVALVAVIGTVMASACTPPIIAGDPLKGTTTGEAFAGVKCSAVRPQTEPDLMAWDPGSRSNLNRLRRQGVVAVRYESKGCNVELELLSNCIGTTGKYDYSPYSANEHKVAHNANELFAQLPVGAARFSGSVKGNRSLRTDYMMAGQYALPAGTEFKASDLRGPDCSRATHVVSALYVGAFAMGAGESRAIEGSATLLGAGTGGKSSADVEVLGDEGDAEACRISQRESKESERCAVPLRIGLLAIDERYASGSVPSSIQATDSGSPARPTPRPEGMVLLPAASFMMGSDDGPPDEKPVHSVTVRAFSMDVTEVTVRAYETCVRAGGCNADQLAYNEFCNWGKADRKNHPINCVDSFQATAFCAWGGKRLPTEEEWEYAARGSDSRKFPWGNAEPSSQLCWKRFASKEGTCAVATYQAGKSPFGLTDMAGNVWEWTSSDYSEGYNKSPSNVARVHRGGSWIDDDPAIVRSADRYGLEPSARNSSIGFRCAR